MTEQFFRAYTTKHTTDGPVTTLSELQDLIHRKWLIDEDAHGNLFAVKKKRQRAFSKELFREMGEEDGVLNFSRATSRKQREIILKNRLIEGATVRAAAFLEKARQTREANDKKRAQRLRAQRCRNTR